MGVISGGSRADATTKMDRFVIIVNGFQPLTITTKRSLLDVAAASGHDAQDTFIKYLLIFEIIYGYI